MLILQRFFKGAHKQEKEISTTLSPPTSREAIRDKNAKAKDMITPKPHRAQQRTKRIKRSKLGCKNLKLFTFICGKDVPKACFYRTLNLNRIGNLNNARHFVRSVKMKREELSGRVGITKRADSGAHVGKKVLPITEASFSSSTERKDHCVTAKTKDQSKGDKKKAISRMKELLTWAAATAAAKTDKRGKFHEQKFQRQGSIKAAQEDDQLSSESPKINFTWDMEMHSITSSVYSAISSIASLSKNGQAQIAHSPIYTPPEESDHITCRKGNWITTDSEFVVLEL